MEDLFNKEVLQDKEIIIEIIIYYQSIILTMACKKAKVHYIILKIKRTNN
jgi:hypothetical protein